MEGDFSLSRYIYEGISAPPPPLFPNYISAFQSEINGGEGSSLQFYGGGGDNINYGGGYSLFGSHPVNNPIGGYNEADLIEFQRNRQQQQQQQEQLINGDYNNQNLMRSLMVSGSDLEQQQQQQQLIPKSEPFDQGWMNMRSGEGSSMIQNLNQLPVLCSLEQSVSQGVTNTDDHSPVSEPSLKRFRSSTDSFITSTNFSRDLVEMPIQRMNLSLSSSNPTIPFLSLSSLLKSSSSPNLASPPVSILARERRKLISDRIRSLQKLMPWNKKMDMATLLEEAYKYIKFLQAQVSVLQAMPCQSSFITTSSSQQQVMNNVGGGGGLEKLNRQQLLKVLLNSPVAQTNLYSKGCCVYSLEQLILLKKIAAHKILLQQMLMARSTSSVYSREDAGRRY